MLLSCHKMYPGTGLLSLSVQEVGTKKVATNLIESSTLDISIIGDLFIMQVNAKRRKKAVKLGDGKVSETGNELDKIKELKGKNQVQKKYQRTK